jgi:alpha-ketoglutarate-dependent taurine dioxygenase
MSKTTEECAYEVIPLTKTFGAEIKGIELKLLTEDCAKKLREEAYMYRFLLFKQQELPWQEQIKVTSRFGTPFEETSSINRAKHNKIPDPRLGLFSNNPEVGLTGIGIEGWHVDGNTKEIPHLFTLIYCVHANTNGPTLIVPLKEIVDMLTKKERDYLESVFFVSAFNSSIRHPLIYKHPYRNDDTIFLALGSLSGQYLQKTDDKEEPLKQLSKDETQYIMDLLHAKVLGSNLIYSLHYDPGDFLMLHNPSIAHLAGPGTQSPSEVSGLRLIHRSSVQGEIPPNKSTRIEYECGHLPPFTEDGYCLFSLKNSVYYTRVGYFDDQATARKRCQNIHKQADLTVIYTEEWNDIASKIITKTKVPHWLNATNPRADDVLWGHIKGNFSKWDQISGQPNDHDGLEDCIVLGPNGNWFDLPCSGPKTTEGSDRAPVMIWEDTRSMRNVYPLCGINKQYIDL